MPQLTEDDIDEILYLARANEPSELQSYLSQLSTTHNCSFADILGVAVDPGTDNSALHYASANGHIEILNMLLPSLQTSTSSPSSSEPTTTATNQLLSLQNKALNTPLHWAALNGHLEVVKALLAAGADPTVLNAAGHDAVYEAEVNNKGEIVAWLLEHAGTGMEKGMGEAMEASGEVMGDDVNGEAEGSSNGAVNGEAGKGKGVEQMREEMDGVELENKDKNSG